jgi:hypothetical protein
MNVLEQTRTNSSAVSDCREVCLLRITYIYGDWSWITIFLRIPVTFQLLLTPVFPKRGLTE